MRASGSVDSPSNATPAGRVERGAQAGLRLLHRVEEDAVGAELAHELRERLVVGDRLAPRADVPRVVVRRRRGSPRAWKVATSSRMPGTSR